MDISSLKSGKYVLALSGGVDSVSLLDLLKKRQPTLKLILAHYNHGIRADSARDEQFVREVAIRYGLKLEVDHGHLGADCSEELARKKRYEFLNNVVKKHNALLIITAHHQDDLIETVFINILRGTGYRGLTAIFLNPKIKRPLTSVSKQEIIEYARKNRLKWVEDSSNQDPKYLRNYIRKHVMPNLNQEQRRQIFKIVEKVAKNQLSIEQEFAKISHNELITRQQIINLPLDVGNELIIYWLRQLGVLEYDRGTVERLNLTLRTASSGTVHNVKNNIWLKMNATTAQLTKTA